MDDRRPTFTGPLALVSLTLEAVVIAHALSVFSVGEPAFTLVLFLAVGGIFWFIHREEQANFRPPSEMEPPQIPPRMVRVLLLLAVGGGLVASALLPRLASMAAETDGGVTRMSAYLTLGVAITFGALYLAMRRRWR